MTTKFRNKQPFLLAGLAAFWATPAAAQTEILTPFEAVSKARERLREILEGSDGALGRMAETLAETSLTGDAWWHGEIALWSLGGLIVGLFVARWVGEHFRHRMAYLFEPNPRTRFDKLSYLLIRTLMMLVNVLILVIVAGAIALGVNGSERAAQIAHGLHIGGVGVVMTLAVLCRNLLAPDVPSHRPFALSDDLAQGLYNGFVVAIAIATTIFFACLWMALLGLDHDAHFLMLVSGLAAIALVFVIAILSARAGLYALIAGGRSDTELPSWRRFLAQNAHILLALYFAVALFVAEVRVLSNQPIPFSPILVPLLVPIAAGYLNMILLLVIDGAAHRVAGRAARKAEPDIMDGGEAPTAAGSGHERVYRGPTLKDIAERGATLLPLARNFLLITVAVMTMMIVASELGVNIAPLFAGAGVVGLAAGFGAQTLIADIFSGAFFLIDDAFRKGDYVKSGGVKGTVGKISVRSMQLRHHMGPLHTIPFSQITHLTNYSRDWAMMKLKLRLTYDTDVERVRKLIKNLGRELMNDPEIGDKFVQPLKSQGVYAMEDSAMIIRVKFMTRPGDQFVLRKRVYAEIRKLFEENGVKFAHREVTVRLAPDGKVGELTEKQREEIAGAVLPVLDADQSAQPAAADGR